MTKQLPKLQELYNNVEVVKERQALNILLNANPKPEWVQEHPYVKGYKYIPIGVQEYLLTQIFSKWKIELLGQAQLLANSVIVSIRLHYLDPVTGEWDYTDGIGASSIQVDKGANPTDISKMKQTAIEMSAPKAKSNAFKDACESLGKIFGKDLNRKHGMAYGSLLSMFTDEDKKEDVEEYEKYADEIKLISSVEDLKKYRDEKAKGKGADIAKLILKRKDELENPVIDEVNPEEYPL